MCQLVVLEVLKWRRVLNVSGACKVGAKSAKDEPQLFQASAS